MSSPRERGTLLDIWLSILLLADIGALIWFLGGYLLSISLDGAVFSSSAVNWLILDCAYLIWNVICLSFLLKWKKWGFYGFSGSVLFVLALNLYFGAGAIAFLGLVGLGILSLGLHSKWRLFD